VMIRVARVWAHRSPSGPSFRKQLPRVAADAPASLPQRTGGPVRAAAATAGSDQEQPLQERQPTQP
jgi:hypothetical protein